MEEDETIRRALRARGLQQPAAGSCALPGILDRFPRAGDKRHARRARAKAPRESSEQCKERSETIKDYESVEGAVRGGNGAASRPVRRGRPPNGGEIGSCDATSLARASSVQPYNASAASSKKGG
jgi:hypothetical protein